MFLTINSKFKIFFLFIFSITSINLYSQIDKSKIRFVVLGDRAGGEQRGVFEDILCQVKTLSPDFVVSIGDLIDGYTRDSIYLNSMWNEFNVMRKSLGITFYASPGNHDISNEIMEKKWIDYWGYKYKSMLIENNMFWFINTEDVRGGGLSETQIEYFKKAFDDYDKSGWIYIFMHRPLWKDAENSGYIKILQMFDDFDNVIVFGGHEHHYVKNVINDIEHYMLSTSGGGNNLRDNSLGEFHHFMYVTMDYTKPIVSNVLYNGVISNDIVSDKNEELIRKMRNNSWISIEPIFLNNINQDSLVIKINTKSEISDDIKLTCIFPNDKFLHFTEPVITTTVDKGESQISNIAYYDGDNLMDISPLEVKFEIEQQQNNIKTYCTKKCFLDVVNICSSNDIWIECSSPYFIQEDWDWHGVHDGVFSFSLSQINDDFKLKIRYFDDVDIHNDNPQNLQDKFFINFSDINDNECDLIITNDGIFDSRYKKQSFQNFYYSDNSYEITIPKEYVKIDGENFSFNIGFMDHDNTLNEKPSILWWRPLREIGSFSSYNHFGRFVIYPNN